MSTSEKHAIYFHLIFGGLAALVLSLPLPLATGFRIWGLVIGYHLAFLGVAARWEHRDWLIIWRFLLPLSVMMVLPDGYLATELGTIVFPDMGAGQIFQVSSFMAGMWAIPLFLVVMVGRGVLKRRNMVAATISAGITALIIIGGSEVVLTRIPVWYAQGVTMVGGVALYVLIPEVMLGATTFWAFQHLGARSLWIRLFAAFAIMCMYLGALVVNFMLIG